MQKEMQMTPMLYKELEALVGNKRDADFVVTRYVFTQELGILPNQKMQYHVTNN
jgi:hypothetical protein